MHAFIINPAFLDIEFVQIHESREACSMLS